MRYFLISLALLSLPTCGYTQEQGERNHEFLNSVLWYQTAGEFVANSLQIYEQAKHHLDKALADSSETAALEQTGDFALLPPAVVMDLDETVLDNYQFEAFLADKGVNFDPDWWWEWIQKKAAKALPGATEFLQYAASKNVRVFYVTDREQKEEPFTLQNLQQLSLPVEADGSNILNIGERPEWGLDKTTRRRFIAQTHRILLLVGDDLNDFFTGSHTDPVTRQTRAEQFKSYWGTQWFILPNDLYGGWELALFGFEKRARQEELMSKYAALELEESICPRLINPGSERNHEMLNAVNWHQTSGEFIALSIQTYQEARIQLDKALADSAWTSSLEQSGNFSALPPAVVLNIDETVLDNSKMEACLVEKDSGFDAELWFQWVQTQKAEPLPGVSDFLAYAQSRNVKIFYVSNRAQKEKADTLANLIKAGLPVEADGSNIMTGGERPEWGSDKTTRRQFIAQTHRILLQIGDGLNDFFTGSFASSAVRNALVTQYKDGWGNKWFILPNSMYGSWERGLYPSSNLSRDQILEIKFNSLLLPAFAFPSNVLIFDRYR